MLDWRDRTFYKWRILTNIFGWEFCLVIFCFGSYLIALADDFMNFNWSISDDKIGPTVDLLVMWFDHLQDFLIRNSLP